MERASLARPWSAREHRNAHPIFVSALWADICLSHPRAQPDDVPAPILSPACHGPASEARSTTSSYVSAHGLRPRAILLDHFMVKGSVGHLPIFHLPSFISPLLYTSTLSLQGELIMICHAVLVLSENANIKRSKRSLKRKDVTGNAKRKSPLELLTNSEQRQVRRKKCLQLRGNDRKRKAKWRRTTRGY